MARWDKFWRDDAYVARNWLAPDPDIVRLSPIMKGAESSGSSISGVDRAATSSP